MPKVKVYKVKVYDISKDEPQVSSRMATEKGANIMRGRIILGTGIEIDADRLERGEEWTPRNFTP